jgi:hypothetical protein
MAFVFLTVVRFELRAISWHSEHLGTLTVGHNIAEPCKLGLSHTVRKPKVLAFFKVLLFFIFKVVAQCDLSVCT